MTRERLILLLQHKEGIRLEFKEARFALPNNLFETICAMLNRDGGNILLGVNDNGKIVGIDPLRVDQMLTDLVNLSNNPQKVDPPFIIFPQKHLIENHWIINIQLPSSSQVHKTLKIIYDRSGDGDLKVTQPQQIAELFNRKRTHYTENIVYPVLRFEDFNALLFPKIRNLIRSNNADHPWLALNDVQLLETAGLWKKDFHTGQEGYTLAAAMLLGKDEVIRQILPHYKIDMLVRIHDINRYDDRLYIQTNLVEAYEQLMGFIEKHLPDRFHLYGDQRVSLRTAIFREVAANIIVHREYINAFPCTFVIGKGIVETENANNPHGEGMINPERFTPFPKNPIIAKFFIQLGRVDELGSGVLNVTRLTKQYAGKRKPEFIEGVTFRMKIPLPADKNEGVNDGVNEGVSEGLSEGVKEFNEPAANYLTAEGPHLIVHTTVRRLFDDGLDVGGFDNLSNHTKTEMMQVIGIVLEKDGLKSNQIAAILGKSRATIERHVKKLKEMHLLRFLGPPKTGGYYVTEYFENRLMKDD
jgi:ATP-dependent DNA helicase RecG